MGPGMETAGDPMLSHAARVYVDERTGPLVLNRWLLGALALSVALNLAAGYREILLVRQLNAPRPIPVVGAVDFAQMGRTGVTTPAMWDPTHPHPGILREILTRFVRSHYERNRAVIARDFADSTYFLTAPLKAALRGTAGRTAAEIFLDDPQADDVEVRVTNVSFTNLTTAPYRASVDFTRTFVAPQSRVATKHEDARAEVAFTFLRTVPNAFDRVNPLGLQIVNLHVDTAFAPRALTE